MIRISARSAIDPTYKTCAECHAALCIYPGDMLPDEVSALLRLSPTLQHAKGEDPLSPWGKKFKAPRSLWVLSSQGSVDSKDLRAHVQWLLSILEPVASGLQSLRNIPGLDMHILCTWVSRYGDGGPYLWPEQLQCMAQLDLPCHFDFYCIEPLFTRPEPELPSTHTEWHFGYVTPAKMKKRGWTEAEITEAITRGRQFAADNLVNQDNAAIRYVHPETGRSIAVDDSTRELIHVGREEFLYWGGDNTPQASKPEKVIFMRLYQEGTLVYRPVPALFKEKDIYVLEGEHLYDPDQENWQFTPGTYVYVDLVHLDSGDYWIARSEVPPPFIPR